jgi:hypothetical protein
LWIDKPLDEKLYNVADYLKARKYGYKRLDFDHDGLRRNEYHADPFHKKYKDPEGFKAVVELFLWDLVDSAYHSNCE